MTDADQGGEWVTGIIGEPFQIDADGKPIPNAPSEQPIEPAETTGILDALQTNWEALKVGEADPVLPLFPDSSPQMIGGGDDETQKEIWEQLERGDFGSGSGSGSIPSDAETSI